MATAFRAVGTDCSNAPPDLVGWWSGDGNANDIVGTNNGTLQGGATANAVGVVGLAFDFDGTNGFVEIPDSPVFRPANLTVEAWVKFDSLLSESNARTGHQYIVFKQNSRTNYFEGFGLGKDTDGPGEDHRFYFNVSSEAGVEAVVNSLVVVTTNVWYHVAGVRGSDFLELYVNGQLEGTTNVNFPQNYGDFPLYFGTSGQIYYDGKLKGKLDEVSLYNRALSSNEIAAIYVAGAAGKCKTPRITAQPQSATNAPGTTAIFSATATGTAPLSYQWQFNGVNLANGTSTGVGDTWETGTSLPIPLVEMASGWLGDKLFVTGMGNAYNPATTSPMRIFNILSNTWTILNPDRSYTGNHHAMEVYGGRLYLIGGLDAGSDGKVQIYDPATNGWSLGTPMPFAAGSCSSAVINGKIYVAGGIVGEISGGYIGYNTNAAAVYDPVANAWTLLAPLPLGMNHTASATDGTKFYVFGGRAVGNAADNGYDTVQIYDPASNTWVSSSDPGSTLAPLPQARGGMGKAIYYNGDFYVMGGETVNGSGATTNHVYDRVDIYNVASNTWRLGAPMPTARHGIYPALRGNRVYVAGGGVVSGVSYSSKFEIYVAATEGRISGATTDTLTIANVQATDGGNYTLRVSNSVGVVTSAVAVLTVNGPPVITAQPTNLTVNAGSNAVFVVTATGAAPLSYQWRFLGTNLVNGGQTSGADTPTLSIANAQPANAGGYSVVVTNSAGSVTSVVAALTVNVPGSCVAPPAGLVGWWSGDGSATNYFGTNNGTLQGGATANAVGLVGQAFSLNGTNNYIQIPDSPVLQPTNLTIEAWVRFDSLDSPGSANVGQQYIVFKQNTRTADFEGFFLGKERGGSGDYFTFAVSSASGVSVQVDSSPLITTGAWYHVAAVRGSNFLQLYLNGQLASQASVTFPQNYGNFPLYFGTSGQAGWDRKFKGNLDEVSLYNRALSSNEIAAIYAAGSGGKCKAAAGPVITAQPQDQSVVVGSNALFAVTATGMAPLSYQWRFNGSNLTNDSQFSGVGSPAMSVTNVQPANAGSYSVVVTNSVGSVTSAMAMLTVVVPPAITAQPQSVTNATGTTAIFSAAATGSLPLSYQWQLNGTNLANGGRISGATTNTLTIANVQATDAGNYTLVVSNSAAAVTSVVATLAVIASPVIESVVLSNGVVVITWSAVSNWIYRLQFKEGLESTNWNDVPPDVPAVGPVAEAIDTNNNSGQRFYRVLLVP